MKLHFHPCPKAGQRPKAVPKPLKRSPVKPGKSRFKEYGANPFKVYHRRYTDAQVMAMALRRRAERLANPTPAEESFALILHSIGIKHEREKIVLNGDRFVLLDFWLPKWNMAIELDGRSHDNQKTYDHDRSIWLAREHGMKVIRFTNREVMSGHAEMRLRLTIGLS
jgi:very-short-patch-repair endonuclease